MLIDRPRPLRETSRLAARLIQHLGREVATNHFGGPGSQEGLGQVARPAGHVEYGITVPHPGQGHRPSPPGLIETERMEAIIEVVGPRNRGEHRPDLSGLLRRLMRVFG